MKKTVSVLKKMLFVVLLGASPSLILAQEVLTEGSVRYAMKVKMPDSVPEEARQAIEEGMPKDMTIFFKNGMSSSTMEMKMMGMSITQKNITKSNPYENISYMDMFGNKIALRTTGADQKAVQADMKVDIQYLDETKTVAGYLCKKVIMKVKKDEIEVMMTAFVTDAIVIPINHQTSEFSQIKGTPLEFEMNVNGMQIHMTALEISKNKVDEALFIAPEGYTVKEFSEINKRQRE